MTALAGLLQVTCLTAVAFTIFAAILSSALYPVAQRRFWRWPARTRATVLFAWAATPVVAGTLLTALCFLPSLVMLCSGGSVADHCLGHSDDHVHLCLVHLPCSAGSLLGWAVLIATLCAGAGSVARQAWPLWRSHRLLAALGLTSVHDRSRGIDWVDLPAPVALTAGLWSPRILLAETLRSTLSTGLLEAVVAHEHAHRRRRDMLRMVAASTLAKAHVPATRRRILIDLHLACEQAADAEAAENVKDPLVVADAILAMSRLAASTPIGMHSAVPAFGGSDITARVEHLLGPDTANVSPFAFAHWWVLAGSFAALLATNRLHHLAESLITPLAR